jgi:NDP-sugar pyrophosphorylase family protein
MKAMIFAAGLGTRLKPLTEHKPKALVEIGGITLLERTLVKLIDAGVDDIIINVHHFHQQIIDFVHHHAFDVPIAFSIENDKLLDTGGGLKRASLFFDDNCPFIIHNVDVISDVNLQDMVEFHCQHKAIATLAVRDRLTQRYLLFDEQNYLCGRENQIKGERVVRSDICPQTTIHRFAFSGIHIVSPQLFPFMPQEDVFPLTNVYLSIGDKVKAYPHNDGMWMDMGKIEDVTKWNDR